MTSTTQQKLLVNPLEKIVILTDQNPLTGHFFIILFLIKVTVYVEYPTRVKHEYMLI